jgi:protein PhnA
MAKGFDKHQARVQVLSQFGKNLARRSKSSCELSGQTGLPLKIYEIAPVPLEPDFDSCLFLSESTIEQLGNPKKHLKPDQWRHLSELIWTDLPQVQLMAVRILQYIASEAVWAQEIIDEAYLEDDLIAKASEAPIGG